MVVLARAAQSRAGNLTALVPIWKRPWMTIGSRTYGVSLLEHLGVEVLFFQI